MVECLRDLALSRPDDAALVVLSRSGELTLNYAQLDGRVRALAAVLQQRCQPADRALILLDNDEHYVVAFFACLYAGVIAVPVFPPESLKEQHLARLSGIALDSQAACILSSSAIIAMVGGAMSALGVADVLAVDEADWDAAEQWRPFPVQDDAIAFLQYTSGSTSAPKGVMVSHANLMANERAIEEGLSVNTDDVFVSWLPLYHDMGLIGGLLQPIHRGILVVLMSPAYFMERPIRWLEAISRFGGTISGGPDFSYRLCVERIKPSQIKALDLSRWRLMFSGAEPVRSDTLAAFVEHFGDAGFSAAAPYPCYGLAEATLFVTGGKSGSGVVELPFSREQLAQGRAVVDQAGDVQVACGFAPSLHCVNIVDPVGLNVLADGDVGEIWVSGPSIAQGYWQQEAATQEAFVEHRGQRWLRTGDLGFWQAGQLYITGRRKDLIILRGHNVYPQDIEQALEKSVEVVRKGRVAAFAVTGANGEGVGVALEVSKNWQKLIPPQALYEVLSQAASEICREALAVVVLLHPGSLPKTSSGKLQRAACRTGWQARTLNAYAIYEFGAWPLGETQAIHVDPPVGEIEVQLAALWQVLLKKDIADRHAHFFSQGGNSLLATQLVAQIREHWQLDFTLSALFAGAKLSDVAAELMRLQSSGAQIQNEAIPRLNLDRASLSFAQLRQWLLWQINPHSNAYHIAGGLRLHGELNCAALHGALQTLVDRHSALRTVFVPHADLMVEQHVLPQLTLELAQLDLRDCSLGECELKAAAQARAWQIQPFDLSQAPLLRAGLIRVSQQESVLVLVLHHIIADGGTMQVLLDELFALYDAAVAGQAPALAAPVIEYIDFSQWQRDFLAGDVAQQQLAWWKNELGDEHPVLLLPSDVPRQVDVEYAAAQYDFVIPPRLAQALQHNDATLFAQLLSAFQALLYRYSAQNEIRIGVPVANRTRSEVTSLVGFFVNTQLLRTNVDGSVSLADLLQRSTEHLRGAQLNQDLPFEQLLDGLNISRSQRPLFQVMFNHLREDFRALRSTSGLGIELYPMAAQTAQFEITLETLEQPDGSINARWVYAAPLFSAQRMAQMAEHYINMLTTLVDAPNTTIGEVKLLSIAEQHALQTLGNNPQRFDAAQPVHRLIEAQVAQRPEATALIFGEIELSYAELNQRANQLAHYLIAQGVGLESKVGIALERGVDMIVALLAVLKAGGAYVPLDPEYPQDRLAYMVADSGINALLTNTQLINRIPSANSQVIMLDTLDLTTQSTQNPDVAIHGDNLAYVIYTSGSTGKPKGVAVAHAPLAEYTQGAMQFIQLQPADRVLQFSTLNFDGFVEQFFPTFCAGAALVLRGNALWDSETFYREVIRTGISVADLTTAYWFLLAQDFAQMGPRDYGRLRQVHAGGEAMALEGLSAWRKAGLSHVKLLNTYGPTEILVEAAAWDCTDASLEELQSLPIGAPLSSRELRILDAELNAVPLGVAGELYIGGALLARGYLNRAELSAERFVADPFDPNGGRLYRTGDLVCWRADGQLEYLGRLDHQVKIRGFRIELGEIEAQLLAQESVREAVVVAQEGPGGVRLVGYVSPHAGITLDTAQLKSAIAAVLPDYMVPSILVSLDALPLNPNGKVDRKALPKAEVTLAEYIAPQGELEQALAAVWQQLLQLERVGLHDSFFEIGGNSLLAMKLHQLLTQTLAPTLSVVDLFKYPTIASLAQYLQASPESALSAQDHQDRAQRQRAGFLKQNPRKETQNA